MVMNKVASLWARLSGMVRRAMASRLLNSSTTRAVILDRLAYSSATRSAILDCLLDSSAIRAAILGRLAAQHTAESVQALMAVAPQSVVEKAFENDPAGFLGLVQEISGVLIAYSQEGEDLLLARLLKKKEPGFYVDVGAHHPVRFSNTHALYLSGWRGINVDATPGSMEPFHRLRPGDVNLECAVSDVADPFRFHIFAEGALNTTDDALAARYVEMGWESAGVVEIKPYPLADLLTEHLPLGQTIDLMSIDVEGSEMGVLRSNDWGRFRPGVLVIEALDTSLDQLDAHPLIVFLRRHGYAPVAKLINSVILLAED